MRGPEEGGAYNRASDIAINTWRASAVFSLALQLEEEVVEPGKTSHG